MQFDFVAIPGKGGAMENWGLLLFDEARFLVNKVGSANDSNKFAALFPGFGHGELCVCATYPIAF